MGNLAFVNEAGGLQSSCLMSRPPSAVADRRFVALAHLSKNSRLVRETVVHHAARDLWSHFSPGTKVQALHWYHVFQKGARWEAGRHFASAMQRLFLWALESNGTAAGTRL
jgi:hypothetical protein